MKKKDYLYVGLLVLVSLIIFYTNYIPGTYLVGWDNLMPELNFKANFARGLVSVWQEYRGLGVEDGMAHAANLVHTAFLYLLSFIFPNNMLRYVFQIGIHLFGGVGMYFLIVKGLKRKSEIAFIGALFYMFNLATIQIFFAPFEVFSTHFGFLPWLVLSALNIIHTLNKKNILLFLLISVLATPQGFVPTVFIAYLIVLGSIILATILKDGKRKIINIIIILCITFISNSFWLMPFLHGALNQGKIIQNAKINQMSSEEIFEKNKYRGKITDVLYMRGFMLDITENNLKKEFVFIMKAWNEHNNQPFVVAISSLFVLCTLYGLSKTLLHVKRKKKNTDGAEYFILIYIAGILLLATNTPIFAEINILLRTYVPFFGEAFRFPYTKFFIMYSFAYTIFFVFGPELLLNKLHSHKKIYISFLLFSCVTVIIYAFPAFRGHFFYDVERIKIPKQYFDVITYFENEKSDARIMTLPQPIFWNWPYYRWGSRGSGFLWYGIKQPMLERPFDPWSNYNEQYFNELFYALQTENKTLFKNVIKKYDIEFILIDKSIVNTNKIQEADKLVEKIKNWIPESEQISFDSLVVFKLNGIPQLEHNLTLKSVGGTFENEHLDQLYTDFGDYYIDEDMTGIYYLFPSLFSNKTQQNLEYEINKDDESINLTSKKIQLGQAEALQQYNFVNVPAFNSKEFYTPAVVEYSNKNLLIRPLAIQLKMGKEEKQIHLFSPISYYFNEKAPPIVKINGEVIPTDEKKHILLFSNHENILTASNTLGKEVNTNLKISFLDNGYELTSVDGIIRPTVMLETFELGKNSIKEKTYELSNPCPEEIRGGFAVTNTLESGISLETRHATNCLNVFYATIPQQTGSLVWVDLENKSGMRPSLIVDNPEQKSIFIETKLNSKSAFNSIIVPPTSPYVYSGYGVHIRNESSGNTLTQNIVKDLSVFYIPYNWLKSLSLVNKKTESVAMIDTCLQQNIFKYNCKVSEINSSDKNILFLSQSFNNAWKAYEVNTCNTQHVICNIRAKIQNFLPFLFGTELTNHVLVNNWSNGWVLNSSKLKAESANSTIVIIFWPQYLEFIGFGLLIGTLVIIGFWKKKI